MSLADARLRAHGVFAKIREATTTDLNLIACVVEDISERPAYIRAVIKGASMQRVIFGSTDKVRVGDYIIVIMFRQRADTFYVYLGKAPASVFRGKSPEGPWPGGAYYPEVDENAISSGSIGLDTVYDYMVNLSESALGGHAYLDQHVQSQVLHSSVPLAPISFGSSILGAGVGDGPVFAFPGALNVDIINEYTPDAGVTIEGSLLKDGAIHPGDDADYKLYKDGWTRRIDFEPTSYIVYDVWTGYLDYYIYNDLVARYTQPSGLVLPHGKLTVGQDDVDNGWIVLYGAGSGRTDGGWINFYLAADHDTVFHYYRLEVYQDDLRIYHNMGVDLAIKGDRSIEIPTGPLKVDIINEYTPDAGVTIEGVLLKDSVISWSGDTNLYRSGVGTLKTDTDFFVLSELFVGSILYTDAITELSAATGVTIEGNLLKDGAIHPDNDSQFQLTVFSNCPMINFDSGDGMEYLRDTNVLQFAFGATTYVKFSAAGIAIDAINEYTVDAGVTIEAILHKDGVISWAGDANLYRSAAHVLKTDDSLHIGAELAHLGSNLGFFGVTPVARAAAYTPSNVTPDRSYDADVTTLDEIADVLGTLIADLQAYGLLQ